MKVTNWINWEQANKKEDAMDGMGGFFNWDRKGMRWKDYIEACPPEEVPYAEAIRESVLKKGLYIDGATHQTCPNGAPVFEDGKAATFSMRGWGDIMAAIWSEEEDKDYSYMDFYMEVII